MKGKFKHSWKRALVTAICLFVIAAFLPLSPASYASGTTKVKMTVYTQVIKSGNTAYCAGAKGIYKVKLKKGRVKSKTMLVKDNYVGEMKKKGNYIYYISGSEGDVCHLCRVNIKTKKKNHLITCYAPVYSGFVIKNNRIYIDEEGEEPEEDDDYYYDDDYDYDDDEGGLIPHVVSIKLNGSDKKAAPSVVPVVTYKKTNAKGYVMKHKYTSKYEKDYLKTPKRKYYLGKARIYW